MTLEEMAALVGAVKVNADNQHSQLTASMQVFEASITSIHEIGKTLEKLVEFFKVVGLNSSADFSAQTEEECDVIASMFESSMVSLEETQVVLEGLSERLSGLETRLLKLDVWNEGQNG